MPGKKSLTEQSRHVEKILYKKNKSKTVSLDSDVGDIKPNMKSKGNKNSKTVASATVDLDAEGAAEYLNSKEIDGETVLDVECGPNKALMYLSKLCQGSKGPCVLFKGSWLTPNEFQYVSGRETAKDWKRSIRHQGKSIKLLFSKGIIVINNTQRKEKRKPGGKRRLRRLSTLVSLETSRDEITESQESGSPEPAKDLNSVNKSPNVDAIDRIQNDQDTEMSEDEGVEIQSDSTENYELDGMDTTPEDTEGENVDTVRNGDTSLQKDLSECEEESTTSKTKDTDDINETETILTPPSEEAQVVVTDDTVTSNSAPPDNDLIAAPKSVEKCSDDHEQNCVVPITFTESESPTIDSQKPEDQQTDSLTKSEELLSQDKCNNTGDKKSDSKRASPSRESKLGNIIDQLRVSKEKINKEPLGDAVSLASGPDQELPPSETVIENCSNCIESKESEHESVKREHKTTSSKNSSNEKARECPTVPTQPSLASNMPCSRIVDDVIKPDRHSKLKDTAKYVDLQRTTIKQEVKENHEKTIRNENDMFYNSSKPKDALLKSKHKLSMEECPSKCVSSEKVRNMAPTPDKLCAAEKDYNSYMKLLAAKQEHSPFLIPPPLHDPYLSLWNPEIPFSNGLFNPFMCFGQNGLPSGLGKQSSSSMPPAFFPFPPSSLPFLTPPRSPYTMPYPLLDSSVPHSSPKESPTLPHSGHPPSKKRGSAETDNACALDLSTKRIKVDSNKNNILSHSVSRSAEFEKYRHGVLDLKYRSKKSSDEKNHQKQSHSDILRQNKCLKAWAEVGAKEIPTKCACGADNPDNIMNWSVDKVYNFVSKLEGCSSYAKTFRDNRIEGKTLPLLTTDTLIRNLGLKVGPAIILSEAVTRHVQDMSRFFHPCSYCKLKSSQRLSV